MNSISRWPYNGQVFIVARILIGISRVNYNEYGVAVDFGLRIFKTVSTY